MKIFKFFRTWEKNGVEATITSITSNHVCANYLASLLKHIAYIGPLEGFYFVVSSNNTTNTEVLGSIDILSRKLCTSLRLVRCYYSG